MEQLNLNQMFFLKYNDNDKNNIIYIPNIQGLKNVFLVMTDPLNIVIHDELLSNSRIGYEKTQFQIQIHLIK